MSDEYQPTTTFQREDFMQTGPLRFATEASQLRLAPGQWPGSFRVTPDLGNGRPFYLSNQDEGQTSYKQEFGCLTITIWND